MRVAEWPTKQPLRAATSLRSDELIVNSSSRAALDFSCLSGLPRQETSPQVDALRKPCVPRQLQPPIAESHSNPAPDDCEPWRRRRRSTSDAPRNEWLHEPR